MINRQIGHWQNLQTTTGQPFVTVLGLPLDDLTERLGLWHDLTDKISNGGHDELQQLYRQRDAFWGVEAADVSGAWFWLGQYKRGVLGRLKTVPTSPTIVALQSTVPNMGKARGPEVPGTFKRFGEHWNKVNLALAALTAPEPPFVLGANFNLAAMHAAESGWNAKQGEIEQTQGEVPQWRAERDVVLGDFSEQDRDPISLISMVYDYHYSVETMKPGSTYAQTLPRIFPAQLNDKEPPKFAYNYEAGPNDIGVSVSFQIELGNLATLLFLKEGDFEGVKPIPNGAGCKHIGFDGVHIVDGVDRLEWRDDHNRIVGVGRFDENFSCV